MPPKKTSATKTSATKTETPSPPPQSKIIGKAIIKNCTIAVGGCKLSFDKVKFSIEQFEKMCRIIQKEELVTIIIVPVQGRLDFEKGKSSSEVVSNQGSLDFDKTKLSKAKK